MPFDYTGGNDQLDRKQMWDKVGGLPTWQGWDRCHNYPRIFMFNRFDSLQYLYATPDLLSVSGGAQHRDVFPALAGGYSNPSSEVPHAPMTNIYAPYRMGKPGIFRGQFTFCNGLASHKSELGKNHYFTWEEVAGAGAGLVVDFGNVVYNDPAEVARVLQEKMNATATGWVLVDYLDPRTGFEDYCFRIRSEYEHKLTKSGTNACLETLGFDPVNDPLGVGSYNRVGHRVLHEREFIIWDTAALKPEGHPEFGARSWGSETGAEFPLWFIMVDNNFGPEEQSDLSGGPDSPYGTPIVAYDKDSWGESGGAAKMVLQASNTLSDLYYDWNNAAKFTEGINQFTFYRFYGAGPLVYSGFPDNPYMIWKSLGRCWGTDHMMQVMAGQPDDIAHHGQYAFPCRYLTANLWSWPYYFGTDWATESIDPSDYRYWMLLMVNRGNVTGRLSIGGPIWLDPGFHPWTPPNRSAVYGYEDRAHQLVNDWGDRFPVPRGAARYMEMQWSKNEHLCELDQYILSQAFYQRRDPAFARYPQMHGLRTVKKHISGASRPIIVMDPTYDPRGNRSCTDINTPAIHLPLERPEWQQTGWTNFGAEPPKYDASRYARGTIFGWASIDLPNENLGHDRWQTRLRMAEIPEEE